MVPILIGRLPNHLSLLLHAQPTFILLTAVRPGSFVFSFVVLLVIFSLYVTPSIFLSILIWVDLILQPSVFVSVRVSAAYRRVGITLWMKIFFFKANGNFRFYRYWLSFPNFPHIIATRRCTSFSWPPFACMFWPRYMYWSAWSRLSLSTTMFDYVVLANSIRVFVHF